MQNKVYLQISIKFLCLVDVKILCVCVQTSWRNARIDQQH
jgi:hypothetical protein